MAVKQHLLATLGEGGLILVVGAASWAAHMPLIFASLGPTAYELVEKPMRPAPESTTSSLVTYRVISTTTIAHRHSPILCA